MEPQHPIYLLDSTSESDSELDSWGDGLGPMYGPPLGGWGPDPYYDMDSSDLDSFSDSDEDDGFFNADPFGFLPRLMYVFQQQHFHRHQARHHHRPQRYIPSTPVNGKRPEYNVHYSPNSVAKCQKCKKAIQEGELRLTDVLDYGLLGICPGSKYTHLACFTPRALITTLHQLAGVSQLQEQDKQEIIKRLQACSRWGPPGWRPSTKEEKRAIDQSVLQLKTVPMLKQICLENRLRRTGRKNDLIERILHLQDQLQPWVPPEQPTPVVEWQLDKEIGLFDVLPEEMILKIISYLGPSDFAHLATVSRHFSEFLQEDLLWKDLYERTWPEEFKAEEETLRKRRREEEEKEEKERKEKEEKEKEKEKEKETEEGGGSSSSSSDAAAATDDDTKASAAAKDDSTAPPAKKQKLHHSAPGSPSAPEALLIEEERMLIEERIRIAGFPFPPLFDFLHRFPEYEAEQKAALARLEEQEKEEEREKEPRTWKDRFYVQHLNALLDQRFQWPQETFMLQDLRQDSEHMITGRADFMHIMRRFDLACLKEICRLYDVDQSGAATFPRATLVERISEAFFTGKISNFDKILDAIKERKARIKGHCHFDPY